MRILTPLFALLFCWQSQADILFINLNRGEKEIEAAERAAKTRGEKVIVIPGQDPSKAALLRSYATRLNELSHSRNFNTTPALQAQYMALRDESNRISNHLTQESLKKSVNDLAGKGVKLSAMVISGHDGNGDFFGMDGSVKNAELTDIFRGHPEMAKGLKQLILAGCYTAKAGLLDYQWKDPFSNLEALYGYNGSAPAADKLDGHTYIYNALARHKQLAGAHTPGQIKDLASKMIPPNLTTNASICLPNQKIVNRLAYQDMKDIWAKCPAMYEKLSASSSMLDCYRNGSPGCENPPTDTHNSPLRDFYNQVQNFQPCYEEPANGNNYRRAASPEELIRLIFAKNVAKNYAQINRQSLLESKDVLLKAGVNEEIADKITKIDQLSRKDIIDLDEKLGAFAGGRLQTPSDYDKPEAASLVAISSIQRSLRASLIHFVPECVPFSWVDDHASGAPDCGPLGKAALLSAEKYLPATRLRAEANEISQQLSNLYDLQRALSKDQTQDPVVSDWAAQRSALRKVIEYKEIERSIAFNKEELEHFRIDQPQGTPSADLRESLERRQRHVQRGELDLVRLSEFQNFEKIKATPEALYSAALAGSGLDRELVLGDRLKEYKNTVAAFVRNNRQEAADTFRREIENMERQLKYLPEQRKFFESQYRALKSDNSDENAVKQVRASIQSRVEAIREEKIESLRESLINLNHGRQECLQTSCTEREKFEKDLQEVARELSRLETFEEMSENSQ